MKEEIEIIKSKLNLLPPELIELISIFLERKEPALKFGITNYQIDEVRSRIQFHNEHPNTKLDFFENMNDLKILLKL